MSSGTHTHPIMSTLFPRLARNCKYASETPRSYPHISWDSLIWNLLVGGRTSIEHVLRSHFRAITDINWHTIEPDIVISTGIDSWQWAWDLRVVQKPIMGRKTVITSYDSC